jgi:hypothetical protein
VIVTTAPVGDGFADGEAAAPCAPAGEEAAPFAVVRVVVPGDPVQAATVNASAAPAATAENARIALMSTRYLMTY